MSSSYPFKVCLKRVLFCLCWCMYMYYKCHLILFAHINFSKKCRTSFCWGYCGSKMHTPPSSDKGSKNLRFTVHNQQSFFLKRASRLCLHKLYFERKAGLHWKYASKVMFICFRKEDSVACTVHVLKNILFSSKKHTVQVFTLSYCPFF
jgi:hypothetical protein